MITRVRTALVLIAASTTFVAALMSCVSDESNPSLSGDGGPTTGDGAPVNGDAMGVVDAGADGATATDANVPPKLLHCGVKDPASARVGSVSMLPDDQLFRMVPIGSLSEAAIVAYVRGATNVMSMWTVDTTSGGGNGNASTFTVPGDATWIGPCSGDLCVLSFDSTGPSFTMSRIAAGDLEGGDGGAVKAQSSTPVKITAGFTTTRNTQVQVLATDDYFVASMAYTNGMATEEVVTARILNGTPTFTEHQITPTGSELQGLVTDDVNIDLLYTSSAGAGSMTQYVWPFSSSSASPATGYMAPVSVGSVYLISGQLNSNVKPPTTTFLVLEGDIASGGGTLALGNSTAIAFDASTFSTLPSTNVLGITAATHGSDTRLWPQTSGTKFASFVPDTTLNQVGFYVYDTEARPIAYQPQGTEGGTALLTNYNVLAGAMILPQSLTLAAEVPFGWVQSPTDGGTAWNVYYATISCQ